MNVPTPKYNAYLDNATPVKTHRQIEYSLFAQVTAELRETEKKKSQDFAAFASAIQKNNNLWLALSSDILSTHNNLPEDLKTSILYLAEFTRQHSIKSLSPEGKSIAPLIDINTSIMRGLKGR